MFIDYLVHVLLEFMAVHEVGSHFLNFMNVLFAVQEHS